MGGMKAAVKEGALCGFFFVLCRLRSGILAPAPGLLFGLQLRTFS